MALARARVLAPSQHAADRSPAHPAVRIPAGPVPDGRDAARPGHLLGRTARARDHPDRRLPLLALARAHDPARGLHDPRRQRFRGHGARMRGAAGRDRRYVDQRAHRGELPAVARGRPCAFDRVLAGWRTGRRGLRRRVRPGVLRREHVQPPPRRIEGRARLATGVAGTRRMRPVRLPVHDRAPRLAGGDPDSAIRLSGAAGRGPGGAAAHSAAGADRGRSRSARSGFLAGEAHRAFLDPHVVYRVFDHVDAGRVAEQPA